MKKYTLWGFVLGDWWEVETSDDLGWLETAQKIYRLPTQIMGW